jgi:drug/metabolite transporter (DMT)-like permease
MLKEYFKLNLAMLCISSSGVLVRSIDLPAETIIVIRSIIGGLLLWMILRATTKGPRSKIRFRKGVVATGVFLCLHWLFYFLSLKASNVATAMISLYTFPILTVFLEPFFRKSKINIRHVLLGVLVLVGILFLVPDRASFETSMWGVVFGLLSAVFYALRNLLLSNQVQQEDSMSLMVQQLVITGLVLSPSLFYLKNPIRIQDFWVELLILSVVTTALGHTLFVKSLEKIRVSTASIISSIQPIYGIILAILILQENPPLKTLIGGVLILATVIIESYSSAKDKAEQKSS